MTINEILNKLRNPYGLSRDEIRDVSLAAADKLEEFEREIEGIG